MKRCPKCDKWLSIDEFGMRTQYGVRKRRVWCKPCELRRNAEYRRKHPETCKRVGKRIKLRRYGLTIQKYEELHDAQGGLCAICGRPEESMVSKKWSIPRGLSVDHDHKTNAVRGLLCRKCNLLIGNAEDSIERLLAAITYLLAWSGKCFEGSNHDR